MPNVQNLVAASAWDGFKNYTTGSGSGSIAGQTLGSGASVNTTVSIALNNSNAISVTKVQFASEESFWRQSQGYTFANYSGNSYAINALNSYSGGNLNVKFTINNLTGHNVTIPTENFNVTCRLFLAPF